MYAPFPRGPSRSRPSIYFAAANDAPASVLRYENASADGAQHLTLRRDGDRLVLVNDHTRTVVASSLAARTERVVIRGADVHDDTLSVDLTMPFSVSGGIEYDGGAAGWDTLVVRVSPALRWWTRSRRSSAT